MSKIMDFNMGKKALKSKPEVEIDDDNDVLKLDLCQMSDIIDQMVSIDKALRNLKKITGLDYDERLLEDEE